MTKSLRVFYPWHKTKRGQGFFVPSLDVQATYEEGLRSAVGQRVYNAHAKVGVFQGFTGVWFYR